MNPILGMYLANGVSANESINAPLGTAHTLLIYLRHWPSDELDFDRALFVAEQEGWEKVEVEEADFVKEGLIKEERVEFAGALNHGYHIVYYLGGPDSE